VSTTATCSFIQGEAMKRPSVVTATRDEEGNIYVGGSCRIVAHGDLLL